MKIWGEIQRVTGDYNNKKSVNKTERNNNVTSKKDVVSISNRAKDYQTVMKAIKDVPDIRQDKVEELRDKYESGKYDVDESKIADRILKSLAEKKG
ncbi:MAG: flagellar biosynthesis anti-sigma factor FlgM [Clostridiaceae bacterium]|nr:flagellar biosynthesis anti-sigma factor FlgM [Clostridiaceae bacterium]